MNDDDLYTLVRTEFEPLRLPHRLHDITARGRGLRRRRRAAKAVAAVGLAAALASGLALALRTGHAPRPPASVQLAAWSVDARPDGEVVLTIRELTHAEELTAALKKAGVPALVEFKQIDAAHTRVVGCEDQQPEQPQLDNVMPAQGQHSNGAEPVFTIRRTAMPAATSLHFVIFDGVSDRGTPARSVRVSLVHGDPVPCKLLK